MRLASVCYWESDTTVLAVASVIENWKSIAGSTITTLPKANSHSVHTIADGCRMQEGSGAYMNRTMVSYRFNRGIDFVDERSNIGEAI